MSTPAAVTTEQIDAAVAALRRGELLGLPTETVYGLAADASNPDAVRRIFELKGRPANHPLIVHLADASQLDQWARDIPDAARQLADAFWPGPLTLILKRAAQVSDLVTGGQDTVGLRVPAHPVALAVLRAFGGGLAAPSANRFGHVSPTRARHVREEFGPRLPLVLDGGTCRVGIESTIVDLSTGNARILRPGRIGWSEIEAVIGPMAESNAHDVPRVSGSLKAHYAPATPIELVPSSELAARAATLRDRGMPFVLLTRTELHGHAGRALGHGPKAYGRSLYSALRKLDKKLSGRILIERPPRTSRWLAVLDRLMRAAAGAGVGDDRT